MQSEPNTPQTPFKIEVADRVKRLPPYLFGKINALKYQKRRDGIDVIDLGMGNPSDMPHAQVIDKLIEAAQSRWRAVNAPHLVALVRAGAVFHQGKLLERPVDITPEPSPDTPVSEVA